MQLAFVAVLIAFPFVASQFGNSWVRIIDVALLYIMLALGLNIVVGFAGLLDLGYIAFFAIGAYLAGLLASPQFGIVLESLQMEFPAAATYLVSALPPDVVTQGLHLSVWLIVPLAALVAAIAGAVLGAPTLKLRGDYLAIVTLGFGEIIRIFMNNLNGPVNITNGPQGINLIDPVRIGAVSFAGQSGMVSLGGFSMPSVNAYYFLFLLLCVLTVFVAQRLQHSRLGRAWVAIREDEIAAKAMGIHVRNVKLLAFAMGASFGGVAGAMFGAFQGFISPESFTLTESIAVLAMVVLGGIGHVPGVILGAVLLAALPEILRHTVEPVQMALFGHVWIEAEVLRQLLYGLALVLIMLMRPAGLWPSPRHEDRLLPQADAPSGGAS
ncbi:MAG: ABC transporter permease subunit [Oxalobacteraceae bacterium]